MAGSSAVLDASIALNVVLRGPLAVECRALLLLLVGDGLDLVAPTLWAYETTSGICRAAYLRQVVAEDARDALEAIQDLRVRLVPPDHAQGRRALDWTLRLGRGAAYDSFYLALAESLRCDLWSADRRLVGAANLPWVRWAGEPPTA